MYLFHDSKYTCNKFFFFFLKEQEIYSWISPLYLDEQTQIDVKNQFTTKSEISLSNFLKNKKYNELCKAFQDVNLSWNWVGTPDQKHYQVNIPNFKPSVFFFFTILL